MVQGNLGLITIVELYCMVMMVIIIIVKWIIMN